MRTMRRKDREMDEAFAYALIDQAPYLMLATTNPDGSPYVIPMTPVCMGKDLFLHGYDGGQKMENIRRDPRVCLCGVGRMRPVPEKMTAEFESFVAQGKAVILESVEEKKHVMRQVAKRYAPDQGELFEKVFQEELHHLVVFQIQIDSITGKRKRYDRKGEEMSYQRMQR